MTEQGFREITIKLGYWEDHPLFDLTEEHWRQWVGDVTRVQVWTMGGGPQYSVKIKESGPFETGDLGGNNP